MPRTVTLAIVCAAAIGPGLGCTGAIGDANGTPTGTTTGAVVTDLPCDVEAVLAARCWACHGETPMLGLPSLTSVAAFMTPATTEPTQTTGAVALSRMQAAAQPMPPPPAARASAEEIAVVSTWIAAGMPGGTGCAPICTSGKTWTGGNHESPLMNPGMACIACHTADEGPRLSLAGTVYPTIHEPDRCDGAGAASGAQVIITGADGQTLTLAPNAAGNFYAEASVARPYRAKVVTAAGERAMTAEQTSGDCNGCHTEAGANGAPGRITLP
jgi:mono/diheme cytochrome c family protein